MCYRCQARHGKVDLTGRVAYDHELGERYRQEEIRMQANRKFAGGTRPASNFASSPTPDPSTPDSRLLPDPQRIIEDLNGSFTGEPAVRRIDAGDVCQ